MRLFRDTRGSADSWNNVEAGNKPGAFLSIVPEKGHWHMLTTVTVLGCYARVLAGPEQQNTKYFWDRMYV